ncbi:MAG: nucleotidyltransferase family protein [Pseudomonadota bacterium]
MTQKRPLMIFAAGFGTRMRPLTDERPKPLVAVAGKPLLDFALDIGLTAESDPIVVNTHYKASMIKDHLADTQIQIIHETPEILDTGGGLRNALPNLGKGAVATLNSDAVWSNNQALVDLWRAWKPSEMDALLSLVPKDRAIGHGGTGDFDQDDHGRIQFRRTDHATYVFTGLQIMKTNRLFDFPARAFSLKSVWQTMANDDALYGQVYDGSWCDVGSPASISLAETLLRKTANG